jgi:acyl CoA:acetate/3-ketoacid CoA transferase alpha subunit
MSLLAIVKKNQGQNQLLLGKWLGKIKDKTIVNSYMGRKKTSVKRMVLLAIVLNQLCLLKSMAL